MLAAENVAALAAMVPSLPYTEPFLTDGRVADGGIDVRLPV